jgi:hypothetical protein
LLATTDRAFQIVVSDHWLAAIFRTRIAGNVASLALRSKRLQKLAFRTVSQTGISYRQSPLSQTLTGVGARAPRGGDRFPWLHLRLGAETRARDMFEALDDTRFHLLVIGQRAPSRDQLRCGDLLEIHEIRTHPDNVKELARVSITAPAYYLLRPDGHVALAGTRFDAVEVKRWFAKAQVNLATSAAVGVQRGKEAAVAAVS